VKGIDQKGRSSAPAPRVLVVGAGAVGQVYALHMQRGGAKVDVFVKPKYAAEAKGGYRLYRMCGKKKREQHIFEPEAVLCDPAEVAAKSYEQIWICVSTTALEAGLAEGGTIAAVLANAGEATVVPLQPGLHVPERLAEHVPPHQMVDGGIAMVAYQAPLVEGEVEEPGVAYFLPSPSPFSGPDAAGVVKLLTAGGCPAEVHANTRALMAYGSATLMPTMTALEGAGWKLAGMRKGPWAKRAARASAEAREVTEAQVGEAPPWALSLITGPTMKLATWVAPVAAPFELEVYLRYHFTKVREQTKRLMAQYIADAERLDLPHEALSELSDAVFGASD